MLLEVLGEWDSEVYTYSDDEIAEIVAGVRFVTMRPDDNPPADFEPDSCYIPCEVGHPEASYWTAVSLVLADRDFGP